MVLIFHTKNGAQAQINEVAAFKKAAVRSTLISLPRISKTFCSKLGSQAYSFKTYKFIQLILTKD